MRIMWWSNAPWASSGYGVQTRLFVPRLIAAGHEVAVCASVGLQGGSIMWEGVRVFPGVGPIGTEVVGLHSQSWGADVTISLFDAWVVRPELFSRTGMRWVPWFPVDSDPVQGSVLAAVRQARDTIVYSKFAETVCHRAGLTPRYVPHGVDSSVFSPRSRKEARAALGCPGNCFLIGMVAANRGFPSRKSIPQVLQAFARFAARRPDAMLYLHMPRGDEVWAERGSLNLVPLVEHLGIRDRIVAPDEYNLLIGFPTSYMVNVYNAMDVLVSPSMGEGFGVPILEAQSCGCPVLVGDWTSMSEICFSGYKVPQNEAEFFWTELQGGQMLPHVAGIERGLEQLYERREDEEMRARARSGALAYDADRITSEYWLPTLDAIQRRITGNPARNRKAELLLRLLEQAPGGCVAEVGCLRSLLEVPSDGHSTLYLAAACKAKSRVFVSFDVDPLAVDTANEVLTREGLPRSVRVALGLHALREEESCALLYLDGADDPAVAFAEFAAASLVPGAVVVVDDAQPTAHGYLGKATHIAKYCARRGMEFEVVETEPGFAAMVMRVPDGKLGLTLP